MHNLKECFCSEVIETENDDSVGYSYNYYTDIVELCVCTSVSIVLSSRENNIPYLVVSVLSLLKASSLGLQPEYIITIAIYTPVVQ